MEYIKPEVLSTRSVDDLYRDVSGFVSSCGDFESGSIHPFFPATC